MLDASSVARRRRSRLLSIGFATFAALGSPTAASAATLLVTKAGVYNYGSMNVSGAIAGYGAFNRNEIGGPVVLQGETASGKPFSVVTFCFDLLHNIRVGFGYQAGVNYTFSTVPLATDNVTGPGTGNTLSPTQISTMSGLAKLGARLFLNGSSDLNDKLPAIQAAIWNIEYGLTVTMANANAQSYYDQYRNLSFAGVSVPGLVARNAQGLVIGGQQSLGLGHGAVPEPASWAMLITGFGAVGAVARRRQGKQRLVHA